MSRRRDELLASGGAAALTESRGIVLPIVVVATTILLALLAWVGWGPLPVQSAQLTAGAADASADATGDADPAGAATDAAGGAGDLAATAVAATADTATADTTAETDAALAWPSTGASAFTLRTVGDVPDAERVERTVTHGDQQACSIASVTKLVTVLRVLDRLPLAAGEEGPTITLTQADADLEQSYIAQNGSTMPVTVGQTLTERQLLELILLRSSNNHTVTFVNWGFGSVDEYLASTPAWLAEHGLDGMTIADPTGIDENNRATPQQIVHLGELALANPAVREIAALQMADVPGIGQITNHNTLVGHDGVDGLKTGSLATVFNLAWSAHFDVDGVAFELVGASLGSTNGHSTLQPEVGRLIASIKAAISGVDVTVAGASAGTLTTEWGATSEVRAAATVHVLTWRGTPVTTAFVGGSVDADADAGAQVGTASVLIAGQQVGTAPLLLAEAIPDPGLAWRATHVDQLVAPTWALVTGRTGA